MNRSIDEIFSFITIRNFQEVQQPWLNSLEKFSDYVRSQFPSPKWSWRLRSPTGKKQLFTIRNNAMLRNLFKSDILRDNNSKTFSRGIQYTFKVSNCKFCFHNEPSNDCNPQHTFSCSKLFSWSRLWFWFRDTISNKLKPLKPL